MQLAILLAKDERCAFLGNHVPACSFITSGAVYLDAGWRLMHCMRRRPWEEEQANGARETQNHRETKKAQSALLYRQASSRMPKSWLYVWRKETNQEAQHTRCQKCLRCNLLNTKQSQRQVTTSHTQILRLY
jgi:hypothetical protein